MSGKIFFVGLCLEKYINHSSYYYGENSYYKFNTGSVNTAENQFQNCLENPKNSD